MSFRRRRRDRHRLIPQPDSLESRQLLAGSPLVTFTVMNINDSGPGSLRAQLVAIAAAELSKSSANFEVAFAIPGTGTHTIEPLSPLPTVASRTFIDGQSQPGYAGKPLIEINGSKAGTYRAPGLFVEGLILMGGEVEGISIDGFAGDQLLVVRPELIEADYVGVAPTGESSPGYDQAGISILGSGADGSTIGGTSAGQGNLISGNFWGIYANGVDGLSISSNIIGLDPSESKLLANSFAGIELDSTDPVSGPVGTGNTVLSNVIAGSRYGFYLRSATGGTHNHDNKITGNTFGESNSGQSFPNDIDDVFLDANSNVNVVSFNAFGTVLGGASEPPVRDVNPSNTYTGNVGFNPSQHGADVGVTANLIPFGPELHPTGYSTFITVTNTGQSTATNIVLLVQTTGDPNLRLGLENSGIAPAGVLITYFQLPYVPGTGAAAELLISSLAPGQNVNNIMFGSNPDDGGVTMTVESDGIDTDQSDKHVSLTSAVIQG